MFSELGFIPTYPSYDEIPRHDNPIAFSSLPPPPSCNYPARTAGTHFYIFQPYSFSYQRSIYLSLVSLPDIPGYQIYFGYQFFIGSTFYRNDFHIVVFLIPGQSSLYCTGCFHR